MPALPEEILSRIVQYIDFDLEWSAHGQHAGNESVSTLRSLCLVSKTFRRLGYYVLYHHFQRRLDSHCSDQVMKLFLSTLRENASLTALVKKVSLGLVIIRQPYQSPHQWRPNRVSPRQLVPNSDGDCDQRGTDVDITFLLSFCAKITSLDLHLLPECGLEGSYLIEVLNQYWNKQSPSYMGSISHDKRMLSYLQSLEIGFASDGDYGSMTSITPFLYLPSLIELEASTLTTCCPRGLSESANFNLMHLHLTRVIWTVSDLSKLLRACPRLETLDLLAGDLNTSSELNFPALGEVLRQHGTLLKNVTIDAREDVGYDDDNDAYEPLLGSLQPLTKLQALKVPVGQLLHIDWIHEDSGHVTQKNDCLSNLVSLEDELWHGVLPESLKQLTLLKCFPNGEWPDECVFYTGLHELLIHLCCEDDELSCDTFTADTRMIRPQSFLSLPPTSGGLSRLRVWRSSVSE